MRDFELSWRKGKQVREQCIVRNTLFQTFFQVEAQNILADSLINGQKLVLLIEEMPEPERIKQWKEMFDPELNHLINSHCDPLPAQLWHPAALRNLDLMVKLGLVPTEDLPDDDSRQQALSERFAQLPLDSFDFLLWTKTKLSETAAHTAGHKAHSKAEGEAKAHAEQQAVEEELLRAFRKRFERSLPLQNVNLIFVESAAVAQYVTINAEKINSSRMQHTSAMAMEAAAEEEEEEEQ